MIDKGRAAARASRSRLMRSAWTAVGIESPFPSASFPGHYQSNSGHNTATKLTRIACLADLPPAPIKIAAFLAYPITRLVFNRASITCIEDRRVL